MIKVFASPEFTVMLPEGEIVPPLPAEAVIV